MDTGGFDWITVNSVTCYSKIPTRITQAIPPAVCEIAYDTVGLATEKATYTQARLAVKPTSLQDARTVEKCLRLYQYSVDKVRLPSKSLLFWRSGDNGVTRRLVLAPQQQQQQHHDYANVFASWDDGFLTLGEFALLCAERINLRCTPDCVMCISAIAVPDDEVEQRAYVFRGFNTIVWYHFNNPPVGVQQEMAKKKGKMFSFTVEIEDALTSSGDDDDDDDEDTCADCYRCDWCVMRMFRVGRNAMPTAQCRAPTKKRRRRRRIPPRFRRISEIEAAAESSEQHRSAHAEVFVKFEVACDNRAALEDLQDFLCWRLYGTAKCGTISKNSRCVVKR